MRTFFNLLILIILFGGCNADSSSRVELTRNIKSVLHSQLGDLIGDGLLDGSTITIRGGDFQFQNETITIAVYDANENGIFNEADTDYLLIGEAGTKLLYIHPSVQTTQIKNENYVKVGEDIFKVTQIHPQGSFIELEKTMPVDTINGSLLKLFKTIPDQSFDLLNGDVVNFVDYVGKGKFIYIDVWGTWCPACIQELDQLKRAHDKYNDKLTIISLNFRDSDKAQVTRFVNDNEMKWVNGFSTETINLEIMQNA